MLRVFLLLFFLFRLLLKLCALVFSETATARDIIPHLMLDQCRKMILQMLSLNPYLKTALEKLQSWGNDASPIFEGDQLFMDIQINKDDIYESLFADADPELDSLTQMCIELLTHSIDRQKTDFQVENIQIQQKNFLLRQKVSQKLILFQNETLAV